jgi:hypothetical protein
MKTQINEVKRMQLLAGVINENLEEKLEYDDFEQMIKPFLDLAKSKNAYVIYGHGPEQWKELKKAPDLYN